MAEGSNVWRDVSTTDVDHGPIVGIDFGTSNSAIAVWHYAKNRVKVIRNITTKQRTTPSTILFDQNEVKIGITPEDTPLHVVEGCKLFLGREQSDGDMDLEGHLGYHFNSIDNKMCVRDINSSRSMSVEEAAARIMSELKASAEVYLQRRPAAWLGTDNDLTRKGIKPWDGVLRRVVVGIPANHTERKKEATRRAALLAGFSEVHFMVESSAAAMAYGLLAVGKKHVLVIDMGCGTLDCTVMHINEGTFRVLATAGTGASPGLDSGCGGRRIDQLVLSYVLNKLNIVVVDEANNSGDSSSSSSNSSSSSDSTTSVGVGKCYRPATAIDIKEPLRGKLLAICRQCKEAFSSLPPAAAASSTTTGSGTWTGVGKGSTIPSDLGYDPNASVSVVFPSHLFAVNDQDQDYLFIVDSSKSVPGLGIGSEGSEQSGVINAPGDGGGSGGAVPIAAAMSRASVKGSPGEGLSCQLTAGEFELLCDPVLRVVEGTVRHTVQQWRRQAAGGEVDSRGNHDVSGGDGSDRGDTLKQDDVLMMDEVVLVGGSSRAIPVQRTVRRALLAEKALPPVPVPVPASALSVPVQALSVPVQPQTISAPVPIPSANELPLGGMGGQGMLEFCSSVDCELAVVQGLAIRGAVLSGREQTKASRLKDLLMMDMLPTAIGLLVWSNHTTDKGQGQIQDKGQDGGGERYFEPVLHKGMRLPCTARRTFALATDDDGSGVRTRQQQRFVSLDVYEEVEEFVAHNDKGLAAASSIATTSAPPSSLAAASSSSSSTIDDDIVYTYQLIGTYDFPAPAPAPAPAPSLGASSGRRSADVVFTMSAEGELTISVESTPSVTNSDNDNGTGKQSRTAEPSTEMMWVLGVYLVLMVALYLAAKTLLSN